MQAQDTDALTGPSTADGARPARRLRLIQPLARDLAVKELTPATRERLLADIWATVDSDQ